MVIGTHASRLSPGTQATTNKTALIAGVTGIVGNSLARHLIDRGWTVLGLARRPADVVAGVIPVAADLLRPAELGDCLRPFQPTHVFFTSWLRQATEAENIRVNGAMIRNLLDALRPGGRVEHVALVTGLKHYLGPFEMYAAGTPLPTPFRESHPRLDVENFYCAQEDELFAAAERDGFGWSVHRPHTMIGYATGNTMNIGMTLAVYGAIRREMGRPFIFPGSAAQWNGLTDMTDARQVARHLEWAATTPAARNQALNVVNGDVFRWSWMWGRLADWFGVEAAPLLRTGGADGTADGRRRADLDRHGRAPRLGGAGRRAAVVRVAHRRRSWSALRMRHRHDQEPGTGLPRLSAHRQGLLRSLRAPAPRAGDPRRVTDTPQHWTDIMNTLFDPVRVGSYTLSHRVVLPPMTRLRAEQPDDMPGALMAAFYAQRAANGGPASCSKRWTPWRRCWGGRVGVRLSPSGEFAGMKDSDPAATFGYAAARLDERRIGYLHVVEPRIKGNETLSEDAPPVAAPTLRASFPGPIIAAGGFTKAGAEAILAAGHADLVAFGRSFVANPDLPDRLRNGHPPAVHDRATLYGGDHRGYLDYPTHAEASVAA